MKKKQAKTDTAQYFRLINYLAKVHSRYMTCILRIKVNVERLMKINVNFIVCDSDLLNYTVCHTL